MSASLSRSAARLRAGGFTLVELLVVVAIMATIAGAAVVNFDGLAVRSEAGTATYNMSAIDQAIRAYKACNGFYPNMWDAPICSDTVLTDATPGHASLTATTGGNFVGLGLRMTTRVPNTNYGVVDPKTATSRFAWYNLTAADVTTLANVGITKLVYINTEANNKINANAPNQSLDITYNNNGDGGVNNTITNGAPLSKGIPITLAAGTVVPILTSYKFGSATAPGRTGSNVPSLSKSHGSVVLCVGIGHQCTLISNNIDMNSATLAQAPVDTGEDPRDRYTRLFAGFLLGTDWNQDGDIDDPAVPATLTTPAIPAERLPVAAFCGVFTTDLHHYNEMLPIATGQRASGN